jgi:hypothetical protein
MGVPLSTLSDQMIKAHSTKGHQEEAAEALQIIQILARTIKHQWIKDFRYDARNVKADCLVAHISQSFLQIPRHTCSLNSAQVALGSMHEFVFL